MPSCARMTPTARSRESQRAPARVARASTTHVADAEYCSVSTARLAQDDDEELEQRHDNDEKAILEEFKNTDGQTGRVGACA